MFTNYMVRFLSNDVATSIHFFLFSVVVLAMATVTGNAPPRLPLRPHLSRDLSDSGFDEEARDRFSNLFVFSRGHLLVMNVIVAYYVPHGRRFSIISCCISLFSSLIIGIATIPNTSPTVAISLFILAILGETLLILCSEFAFAPPVHLHLMSERHGGTRPPPPPLTHLHHWHQRCAPQVSSWCLSASPSSNSRCARPTSSSNP